MLINKSKKAILMLESGVILYGKNFGAEGETIGEVVFNTAMCGYQEILTDASYKGQIVVMTYPHIGNYGIIEGDYEGRKIYVEGLIVKEASKIYSSWQASKSIHEFLKEHNIVGIEDVDTRYITRQIRDKGSMKGIISTEDFNINSLKRKLAEFPDIVGRDLVKEVTCEKNYIFSQASSKENLSRVVVLNFGVKLSILTNLAKRFREVYVVRADTKPEEILSLNPDGILLSNGPGDPAPIHYAITTIQKLLEKKIPMFGICLGHQLLALSCGMKTYKLKFGHHGSNHPVKDISTNKVYITVQNHCFAVSSEDLSKSGFELWFVNLNDYTVEGMKHKELPIFSVQFHPEASPGPLDTLFLFDEFIKLISTYKYNNI